MNISVAKNYQDKNTNAQKTKWITVGSIVIGDDGKVFGEIEAIPYGMTEFKFNCYDRDEKQPQQQHPNNGQQMQQQYQSPQGYGHHNTGANAPVYDDRGNRIG
jgi:hypothetical protein